MYNYHTHRFLFLFQTSFSSFFFFLYIFRMTKSNKTRQSLFFLSFFFLFGIFSCVNQKNLSYSINSSMYMLWLIFFLFYIRIKNVCVLKKSDEQYCNKLTKLCFLYFFFGCYCCLRSFFYFSNEKFRLFCSCC